MKKDNITTGVWQTVSSKVAYKGKRLTLLHDEVLLPNGKKGEYDYVQKNDFVLVIPEINNEFILVEQYRYTVKKRMLEFPMGVMNSVNEIPEECARRELEEETGLKPKNLQLLARLDAAKGTVSYGFYVFYANEFEKGQKKRDDTESDMQLHKIKKEEFETLIAEGKITDSPTLAAYTLYLLQKKD